MATQVKQDDWSVTPEKVSKALRRIVEVANPLQVILFGSRARGNHRTDSDVDIAVVIDGSEEEAQSLLPTTILRGIRMEVTLIVVSKAKYDLHRPWINSVFNYIDREGIILYDRNDPKSARTNALPLGAAGRDDLAVSVA